jgi:HlyD family secretion protein
VKEYKAFVHIDDASADLRSGMTASVTVHCANVPNALQVPVQAMYAHGPKFFCFVYDHGQWNAREVKAGPTNDKTFVIESGLKEGEQVAMNPRAYLADVTLPKLPPEEIQRAVPQAPSARTAENSAKPSTEKVAARSENAAAPAVGGANTPGGKSSSGEGKRRKQGGGVPAPSNSTQASAASTKRATAGAAQ